MKIQLIKNLAQKIGVKQETIFQRLEGLLNVGKIKGYIDKEYGLYYQFEKNEANIFEEELETEPFDFQYYSQEFKITKDQLISLIVLLLKNGIIKGSISPNQDFFTSKTVLKNLIRNNIKKSNFINIVQFAKKFNFDTSIIIEIINELETEENLKGFLVNEDSVYRLEDEVKKEIKKYVSDKNWINLTELEKNINIKRLKLIELVRSLSNELNLQEIDELNYFKINIPNLKSFGEKISSLSIPCEEISKKILISMENVNKLINFMLDNKYCRGTLSEEYNMFIGINAIKKKFEEILEKDNYIDFNKLKVGTLSYNNSIEIFKELLNEKNIIGCFNTNNQFFTYKKIKSLILKKVVKERNLNLQKLLQETNFDENLVKSVIRELESEHSLFELEKNEYLYIAKNELETFISNINGKCSKIEDLAEELKISKETVYNFLKILVKNYLLTGLLDEFGEYFFSTDYIVEDIKNHLKNKVSFDINSYLGEKKLFDKEGNNKSIIRNFILELNKEGFFYEDYFIQIDRNELKNKILNEFKVNDSDFEIISKNLDIPIELFMEIFRDFSLNILEDIERNKKIDLIKYSKSLDINQKILRNFIEYLLKDKNINGYLGDNIFILESQFESEFFNSLKGKVRVPVQYVAEKVGLNAEVIKYFFDKFAEEGKNRNVLYDAVDNIFIISKNVEPNSVDEDLKKSLSSLIGIDLDHFGKKWNLDPKAVFDKIKEISLKNNMLITISGELVISKPFKFICSFDKDENIFEKNNQINYYQCKKCLKFICGEDIEFEAVSRNKCPICRDNTLIKMPRFCPNCNLYYYDLSQQYFSQILLKNFKNCPRCNYPLEIAEKKE